MAKMPDSGRGLALGILIGAALNAGMCWLAWACLVP
jgi:hypothetical protein